MPPSNYRANSKYIKAILLIVVLICVLQIGILWIPEGIVYRVVEYFSSDLLLLVLSIVIYLKTSHRNIYEKACWSAVILWHLGCWVYNISIQMFFENITVAVISSTAITFVFVIMFAFRYILTWSVNKTELEIGCFYEVIGKPTNLSQLIVAMYSGRGGSFGITDGIHLWHYSKEHDSMINEKLSFGYTTGRMVKKICVTSKEKYNELDAMTGQRFTFMHNCLELHALSGRWRYD